MNKLIATSVILTSLLTTASNVVAQLPTADLSRIAPRAARAGESVEVSLVGQNLEELNELRFTHPGITAQPVLLPSDEFFPEPRINGNRFNVTVAKNVPAGIYEARAVGYFGLSTDRPFVVAPANSNEVAGDGKNTSRETALAVDVNTVVSGDIPGRGMHWFKFTAKAGQRVLLEVHAERIDSRLDSQLVVYDADGNELNRNRDTFGRDSFLEVRPDSDAEFFVVLSDILYRGGAEHFYRLSISDRPHVDFIWPPAGVAGTTQQYTLYGRNLPNGVADNNVTVNGRTLESVIVDITLPAETTTPMDHHPGEPRQGILPGFDFQLADANTVRIGFASGPVAIEDELQSAQRVSCPCEIAGRFGNTDDEDTFRFTAEKDKTYFVEVIAHRMASPVDPYVIIHKVTTAEDGQEVLTQIADNDDMPSFFSVDGKDSINADTNDAAVSFTSDHDGDCSVTVINQLGDGGAGHIYRLAIREQTPDFQIIATTERTLPSNRTGYSVTPILRQGARWGIRILCPRQDNFEGDIVITAEDLPPGVTASPLTLSGKTDRGILVVSADADAKSWAGDIRIVGRSTVNDRQLVREARFASLVWGHIFADSIRVRSRLSQRIPLSVNEHEMAPVIIQPTEQKEWTVEIGQPLELPIKLTDTGSRKGAITIEPQGLFGLLRSPPTVNIAENETEGKLTISFAPNGNFTVEPGRYQFTLQGTGVAKYRHNDAASVRAAAELSRVENMTTEIAAAAETAKSATETAKQKLESIKQTVAAAADDEAKAKLQPELDAATAEFEAADKAAKAAIERVKAAENAKKEIEKVANDAAAQAAEKDTTFAAWSDLITVVVTPKKM